MLIIMNIFQKFQKATKKLVVKNFEYPSQDGYTKKHKYFILDN